MNIELKPSDVQPVPIKEDVFVNGAMVGWVGWSAQNNTHQACIRLIGTNSAFGFDDDKEVAIVKALKSGVCSAKLDLEICYKLAEAMGVEL